LSAARSQDNQLTDWQVFEGLHKSAQPKHFHAH